MTDKLKIYACAATVICLLTVAGMTKWQLHSVQSEYKTYKDNINDQVQQAKIEKARIEAEQRAKHDKEVADLAADRDRLKRILIGLRKPKDLPRDSSVPVAGSGSSGLPRTSEDTSRSFNTITIEARTGSFTYENAMMDVLQCSRLIEFVSK
jgi:hypothetical protein